MWIPGKRARSERRERARRYEQMRTDMEARARIEAELSGKPATRPRGAGGVRRMVFRGRRVLSPFAVMAVLWAGGFAASTFAVPPGQAVVLWLLVFGVVWLRRLRGRLARRSERRYTTACVVAGAGWLVWACLAGAGTADAWLVVGWAVLAAPWWVHHWPRGPIPIPAAAAEPVSIESLWRAHVADTGGPLPGATLFNPVLTEHGRSWSVQLVPGRQPLGTVLARIPAIAQGVREPYERILLEQHPDTRDPSIGKFQVIDRSPIESTVYFERPHHEDGWLHVGPHSDGMGDARWRLFTENSMWGGYLLGSLGSGKSRLMELLTLTARDMGALTTVYIDGQDGASSSTMHDEATWSGGLTEADAMLTAIEAGMRIRQKYNRVHRLSGFTPSAEMPGVLIVIDECHKVFRVGPTAERWAAVAREGRKVGFAILAASQVSGLDVFGNSEALRSSLLAGNCIVMRTASRMSGNLITGFDLNPADLPALPGYGYVVAAPGSGARTAPFRTRYLPDAKHAATHDLPVPTVEEWFAKTSDAPLDDMTARAFGAVFLDRHRLAEESTRAAWDEIEGRTPSVAPAVTGGVEDESTTRGQILAELAKGEPLRPVELERRTAKSKSGVRDNLRALLEDGLIARGDSGYALVRDAVPAV